jgi:hypothetical protein
MSEHFEASCLCGGITLSYTGSIGPANYCHCEDCRRANGSAFNIGVRVERKDLKVEAISDLRRYKYVSGSGKEIERCFCGKCGSPIFTLHPAMPDYAWVKAGIKGGMQGSVRWNVVFPPDAVLPSECGGSCWLVCKNTRRAVTFGTWRFFLETDSIAT